jgi:hypothetical protein
MNESFTKLFSTITSSTIWAEDSDTRIVWVTMLAMANKDGYVGASVPGLAHAARVSVEAAQAALDKFLAPDKYSRSQEHEGRRIAEADRGWVLLNYSKFRDLRNKENKRAQSRDSMRRMRDKGRQSPSDNLAPDYAYEDGE